MSNKDCRSCVYHIGKLHKEPRFMWTHCKAGISNLTTDTASECEQFAGTVEEALVYRRNKFNIDEDVFIKKMGWDWYVKCPCCGRRKWEIFTLNAISVVKDLSLNYHDQDKNQWDLYSVLIGTVFNTERIEQSNVRAVERKITE